MILLFQIAVILAVSRALRILFAPLRQPAVIAEMVAGLLIGPSALGWLLPQWSAVLFPADSLRALGFASQIGLVTFMFFVGMSVRRHRSTGPRGVAVFTSFVSIVVPFALGVVIAWALRERLALARATTLMFMLFIGAAMSITAFPVLARILADRGLIEIEIGRIAIACAAVDDVIGWLMVAAILELSHGGDFLTVVMRVLELFAYLAIMKRVISPVLGWIMRRSPPGRIGSVVPSAVVIAVVIASVTATEAIGVHVLFGAFFAGLIMPPKADERVRGLNGLEWLVVVFLLPLFFAVTGLRMNIRLLNSTAFFADALIVLAAAIVGKGFASTLAARAMGMAWRSAAAVGVLVNTRGMVELVILNIGLDAGVLSPVTFSMFVIMTVIKTFMASPLLELLLLPKRASMLRAVTSQA